MHLSVRRPACLRLLLREGEPWAQGCRVFVCDDNSCTPLHLACGCGAASAHQMAELLLQRWAEQSA